MSKNKIQDDFQKLEKIVGKLENQQLSLDESLKLFEEGSEVIKKCHSQLKRAKNKFEEIKKDLESEVSEE